MDSATKRAMEINEAMQHRQAASLLLREAGREFQEAEAREMQSLRRGFSLVKFINAVATEGVRDGAELEASQLGALLAGERHDPHRSFLPWRMLGMRTLVTGTGSFGGYLVGSDTPNAVQALFAYSTVIRAGAQVVEGLVGNQAWPRFTGNGTAAWPGETGTGADSTPTVGQVVAKPLPLVAHVTLTRQLTLASPLAEAAVSAHLLGLVGAALDSAALAGTGTNAPLGIINTPGVTLTTGTGFDMAAAAAMVKAVSTANAADPNLRFIGTPANRELLAKRAANGTGSAFLWRGNALADVPAAACTDQLAGALTCGDWTTLYLLLWGSGLRIESNPYANFQAGNVSLRVLAGCNVAVTQPGAFACSTGVT